MILSNRLTFRYMVALTIIAALLTGGYVVVHDLIKTQENGAALINISGRQRMLAQRTALLSLKLAQADDPVEVAALRRELLDTVNLIEQNQQSLAQGDISALSRQAQMLGDQYRQDCSGALNEDLASYIAAARKLADGPVSPEATPPELAYVLRAVSGSLVADLDAEVDRYQRESEQKIAELKRLETIIFTLALIVLALEAVFIFRPAVQAFETEHTTLQGLNDELRRLSTFDGLTGIANRRFFDMRLSQVWGQGEKEGQPVSLIMIDIDHFKAYNDTYGHLAGDDCLKQVAITLQAGVMRTADCAARYGGEEFAVLLPDTTLAGALMVAERLRAAVAALGLEHTGSLTAGVVTVSLGVACAIPDKSRRPDTLVEAADKALYEAKRTGRNRVIAAA
ncbi:MAG: diguanylate cyclase [Negativicutes bacterium]|nr:diguanylate cyclase [Negativicutes bacterium]